MADRGISTHAVGYMWSHPGWIPQEVDGSDVTSASAGDAQAFDALGVSLKLTGGLGKKEVIEDRSGDSDAGMVQEPTGYETADDIACHLHGSERRARLLLAGLPQHGKDRRDEAGWNVLVVTWNTGNTTTMHVLRRVGHAGSGCGWRDYRSGEPEARDAACRGPRLMSSKKGRSRYKPRPLAILTIPAEHFPVPGAETVRLRFFSAVAQDRAERARQLEARRFLAKSQETGFDESKAARATQKVADDEADEKPTPIEAALQEWPGRHVVRESLHSIVAPGDDPTDDPIETPETPEDEREAWLADQSSGALEWLAEKQFDAAGLLRETEGDRGEG